MGNSRYSKAALALIVASVLVAPSVEAQSLILDDSANVIVDYSAISPSQSSRSKKSRQAVLQPSFLVPYDNGVYVAPSGYDCPSSPPAMRSSSKKKKAPVRARATTPKSVPALTAPSQRRIALSQPRSSSDVKVNLNVLNTPELQAWPGFPFENSGRISLVSPSQQEASQQRKSPLLLQREEKPLPLLQKEEKVQTSLLALPTEPTVKPLASPVSLLGPHMLVVAFPIHSAILPPGSKADLDALLKTLQEKPSLRVTVRAYGEGKVAGSARKLSLSRALAIRSYLVHNGIDSARVDIEALGNNDAKLGKSNTVSIDVSG